MIEKYADIYVKQKDKLIPLMERKLGKSFPKAASHRELVPIYIGLLKDTNFAADVDKLDFSNAVDPISVIAEAAGKIAGMFDGDIRKAKIESEAQSDAALAQLIMEKQSKNNTGKILLFSGVALLVIGCIITVIILKRRK